MKKLLAKITSKNRLVVFLVVMTSYTSAQISVTGKVIDINQSPVELANVVLINKENNDVIAGTVTDNNGNFIIQTEEKGVLLLQISFVGFNKIVKSITSSIDLGTLVLQSKNELGEVVINARKKLIERKDDIIVFNVRNSPINKGNDGMEVLENTPVIWVNNSDQVLIHQKPATLLINGRKINLTGTDLSNYIKNIPSENIQRIEIQTNASANIDGDVTGGIVNIIVKKKLLGINGSVKSYYSRYHADLFDLYDGVSLNYGSNKWNTYLLYNFTENKGNGIYHSDFILKENQGSQFTGGNFSNQKNNHNYQLGFTSELSKNHAFGIELYGTNSNNTSFDRNEIYIADNSPIAKADNSKKEQSEKYIYNTIINYNYTMDTLGGNIKVIADYLKHNYNVIANNQSIYEYGNMPGITEKNITHSNTDAYTIQTDLHKTVFKKIKTDIGVKYTSTKRQNSLLSETLTDGTFVPNDRTSKFDYRENIMAGYFSVGYHFNEKNYLKAGMRIENTDFTNVDIISGDKNSRNYISWFPSIYYSKEITKNNTVSASYSRRLRRPSFSTLNNRVNKINDFSYDIGNPGLNPEFINRFEIQYNRKSNYFTLYLDNTDGAISGIWRMENGIAIHQNQNAGMRTQYGVQYSSGNINIDKWWKLRGNFNFYNKIFKTPDIQREKATFFGYIQNRFIIDETTSIRISGNYMSPFLSSYYTSSDNYSLDMVIKKSFFNNKLQVRFYVDDILNSQKNKLIAEFPDSDFSFYQKRNTRSFTLWLRYVFSTQNKIRNSRNDSDNKVKNRL